MDGLAGRGRSAKRQSAGWKTARVWGSPPRRSYRQNPACLAWKCGNRLPAWRRGSRATRRRSTPA